MIQISSHGQKIAAPNPTQVNQDFGFEWRFPKDISSYEASYKVCRLKRPVKTNVHTGNRQVSLKKERR